MYEALARYYDCFMEDVDYGGWLDYVEGFVRGKRTGIDFGCGSGRFTVGLARRGYEVCGVDISPQMLSLARDYAARCGVRTQFLLCDMSRFDFLHAVDFVTAMCDAVNYLPNPAGFFGRVYAGLKPGGVFVFDVSSAYKLVEILGNNTYSDAKGDITYIWHNARRGRRVDMELTFFEGQNGLYKKSVERQTQYIHETDALARLLSQAGFDRVEVYGKPGKKPRHTDERLHFISTKRES